ncbi:MAG: Plug domain-containing protein [Robiginitalea sp.]|uniref:TonB-dependent receptor n=1 Tax=Robiginitalea sp. TaxID=1902411 RepID=UPI003C7335B9
MTKYVLLLTTSICLGTLSYAQGDRQKPAFSEMFPAAETVFQDRTVTDSLALWEERVYLHMDREQAEAGDAIFFKAYVYNGPTQKRFSPSGVLRLELRDSGNELVSTQYHPVKAGSGEGVVKLPKTLKDGPYELLAYTRWMKNYGEQQFYRKTIQVGETPEVQDPAENLSDHRLEFYPEGGRLLAGISNRLVLTSQTADGEYGSVEGSIVDEKGLKVVEVQSYSKGYGLAIFQPEAGKTYSFKPTEGPGRALPEIQSEGYSLRVNALSSEKIRMEVRATESLKGSPVVLEGKKEGQSYFVHVLEFEDGAASLDISKAALPHGLMTFYLRGMDQVAWAERPVWIDSREELTIAAQPLDSRRSKAGEKVIRIKVTDAEGNPVQTDLSASVNTQVPQYKWGIEQYLKPIAIDAEHSDDRSIRFLEDLKAQSLASGSPERELPSEIRYPVERSLELHGTVYDFDNRLLTNTKIQMMASSDSELVIRELETDAAGVLHVQDIDVIGETQFIFRTEGEEQSQRLVKLQPIDKPSEPKEAGADRESSEEEEVVESKTYRKTQRKKELVESTLPEPFDTTGVIKLKEVTVEELRRKEQEMVPSLYGIKPNRFDVVYQDPDRPLPMERLVQKIPGVQVQWTGGGTLPVVYHNRRGGGRPLWVVDGQVIRFDDPAYSPLTFVTALDILRIEFIMDAGQAAVFGVQASTGVMLVYTRSGNFLDYVNRKEGGLYFKGYEPAPDFETYMAERQKDRKLRKIPSPTLYWNPSIQTDTRGEAIIRFSTPEDFEGVVLSIETLTPDGRVGSFRKSY